MNFRFTKLSKETPVLKDKQNKPVQLKSSEKNRKLALQMANRPSVQAALKIKNVIHFVCFFNLILTILIKN